MNSGVVYREFGDVSVPSKELDNQGHRLTDKFVTLASPIIGDGKTMAIVDLVRKLEQLDGMDELLRHCR